MNNTIVTVCDKNFLWAAYLLIASLRHHNVNIMIHVLARDFAERERSLLEQFGNVRIIDTTDRRTGTLLKPEAILTAETEYITWIDADCIVTGDIAQYFLMPDDAFCVQFRNKEHTARMYRAYFGTIDEGATIPKAVLEKWQRDVGEKTSSAIDMTYMTYCFMFHRRYLNFIEKWRRQILKVIPKNLEHQFVGTIDRESMAYNLADESVLNSLFAFAYDAPSPRPMKECLSEKGKESYLVHFNNIPKPWQMWRLEHLRHFDHVMDVLDWIKEKGYEVPAIPWALKRRNKPFCYAAAYVHRFIYRLKERFQRRIYKGRTGDPL